MIGEQEWKSESWLKQRMTKKNSLVYWWFVQWYAEWYVEYIFSYASSFRLYPCQSFIMSEIPQPDQRISGGKPYRTYQSGRPPLVRVRLLFLSSQTQPDPVASMVAPTARIFEQMHHCDKGVSPASKNPFFLKCSRNGTSEKKNLDWWRVIVCRC